MKQITTQAKLVALEPAVEVTKIEIEINVATLLDELKLFDALFHVELLVNEATYHYSFVKRNITQPIVLAYMFVEGKITSEAEMSYTVLISYISKA